MASKNIIDNTYQQWLAGLKEKIRNSQLKAALQVNTQMLALYWEIGKELTEKQEQSSWGDKVITQLAKDLGSEFPGVKGFSATNLKYIRKWFQFYNAIGQQAVDQLRRRCPLARIPLAHRCKTEKNAGNTSGSTLTGP